jgi:hypothetical protein
MRPTPPPGTMPSSTAARVACRASASFGTFCFLHLGLGGCANVDDGDAAGELGKALMGLLVVGFSWS